MVKSRDFVNLRSCRLIYNGKICDDDEAAKLSSEDEDDNSCEGSVTTITDNESHTPEFGSVGNSYRSKFFGQSSLPPAEMVTTTATSTAHAASATPYETLSKSLGAKSLGAALVIPVEPPPLDDEFEDAKDQPDNTPSVVKKPDSAIGKTNNKVWMSAAISVEYPEMAATTKYIR